MIMLVAVVRHKPIRGYRLHRHIAAPAPEMPVAVETRTEPKAPERKRRQPKKAEPARVKPKIAEVAETLPNPTESAPRSFYVAEYCRGVMRWKSGIVHSVKEAKRELNNRARMYMGQRYEVKPGKKAHQVRGGGTTFEIRIMREAS